MKIGVLKETAPGERRVALVPDAVRTLVKQELAVAIEAGAGAAAGFEDEDYREAGAEIEGSREKLLADSTVVLKVQPPQSSPGAHSELDDLRQGTVLICYLNPLDTPELALELAERDVVALSVELMPRVTKAQAMDVLSSQSTIAGYRAVLLASMALPRIFPMLVTAAGTLQPAKVLVIGAGVAGLQALGTAKRLGAVTSAYDTREAVKEQVVSVGARFVQLELDTGDSEDAGGYAVAQTEEFYERQRAELAKHVAAADVVITTALVPGQTAPVLISEEAVKGMRSGSVIVDLAAAKGGNCPLSKPDETVVVHGVTILGNTNMPAEIPAHASQMYAKNLVTFLDHLIEEGELKIDREDEITRGTLVTYQREVVSEVVRSRLDLAPLAASEQAVSEAQEPGGTAKEGGGDDA